MSVQAITWALKQQAGDPRAKVVLICLANYADEHGRCWPSQARLAEQTEQSVDTVSRRLLELEERGLVRREMRRRVDGTQASDLFVLLMQPELPLSDPLAAGLQEGRNLREWRETAVLSDPQPAGPLPADLLGAPIRPATVRYHEPSLNRHLKEGNPETQKKVTWVQDHEPLWPALAARYLKERGKPVFTAGSKHDTGTGYHFPHDWVVEAFNASGSGAAGGHSGAPQANPRGVAHGRR